MLVTHIIEPDNAVELIARIPNHVQKLDINIQEMIEHIHTPFGILQKGKEQPFSAYHPGMSDVKAKP